MNTRVSTAPLCAVAVYRRGQRTNSTASTHISRDDAQYMVDCGVARWVNNRYKSIVLLIENANCKLRDLSATMGPEVIFKAATGSPHHKSLVEGWAS